MVSVFKANVTAHLGRPVAKQDRKCNIFAQYQLFEQQQGGTTSEDESKLLSCNCNGRKKRGLGDENPKKPVKPEDEKT